MVLWPQLGQYFQLLSLTCLSRVLYQLNSIMYCDQLFVFQVLTVMVSAYFVVKAMVWLNKAM